MPVSHSDPLASYDISDLSDHDRRDAAIDALDDGDLLLAVVMIVSKPLGPGVAHDTACLDAAQFGMRAKTPDGAAAIFRQALTKLAAKTMLEYAARFTGWRPPPYDLRRVRNQQELSAAAHVAAQRNGQALLTEILAAACARSAALNGDTAYQSALIRQRAADDVRNVVPFVSSADVLLATIATGQHLDSGNITKRLCTLLGTVEAERAIDELVAADPGLEQDSQLAWARSSLRRENAENR